MSQQPAPKKRRTLNRRDFLILLGVGATGAYLGIKLGTPALRLRLAQWIEDSGGPPTSLDAKATAWLTFDPDGTPILYLPKSEMGQGIHTALAQIAAEELEINWQNLRVRHAATGQGLEDPVGTSASVSVSSLYQPLREAAATLRELLRAEAAQRFSAPLTSVHTTGDGSFIRRDTLGEPIPYGSLFQNAANWQLPEAPPPLKNPRDFQTIGAARSRVDLPEKITGKAQYGLDVRLPGMLYGAVARPPTVQGKLTRAAAGTATQMPGVVQVVIQENFAGVVAHSRKQAYDALNRLDLTWDEGTPWQQSDIEALVTAGGRGGVTIQQEGNLNAAMKQGKRMRAEYRTPMAYHAHLEPLAAVAHVQTNNVQIYASTQSPVRLRSKIAAVLQRPEEEIIVTPVFLGGGFGRKIDETCAVDAARLSAAVGQPVQVALTRKEDFQNGFVRPPTHHILEAVLDPQGNILGLQHLQASGEVAFPFLPDLLGYVMGADFGSWRGALWIYSRVPAREVTTWLARLPVFTGWWRGLGLLPNTFASESFIDELAHAASTDPLEFRLRHLGDDEPGKRLRAALQAAADSAGWSSPPPSGRARGIACCYDARTVVAHIAEVSTEGAQIRVHKVTSAIDPGLIINPDGVRAQTQGAVTMGISSTLREAAMLQNGRFVAENFDKYPLLQNAEAPDVEVILLQSGHTPYGMGEPPIGAISAAVANAIFSLTGKRLRNLPLRLDAGSA